MRKTLAILLTLSIIAQGMVNLALCTYFKINQKAIIEKLCINKNKPMMHCNGQCYLGQQLKKAEENEKRQSRSLREKDEVLSLYSRCTDMAYIPDFSFISYIGCSAEGCLAFLPHIVIDQPPQV